VLVTGPTMGGLGHYTAVELARRCGRSARRPSGCSTR